MKKRDIWLNIIGILLFFGVIISGIMYSYNNISELKFCDKKVNTYFPEYNNIKAVNYNQDNNQCVMNYITNSYTEQRDELKMYDYTKSSKKSLYFEIINLDEQEYLAKDDNYGLLFGVMLFLMGIFLIECISFSEMDSMDE